MSQNRIFTLVLIILLVAGSLYAVLPNNAGIHAFGINRDLDFVLGLDLRGGVQTLLEVPASYQSEVTTQALEDARRILENRTNALGVSENTFQVVGERRILAEFPGLDDPEQVIDVIKETGQLEFVDLGDTFLPEGTVIQTDLGQAAETTTDPEAEDEEGAAADQIWHTVMTGDQLRSVSVISNQVGGYQIAFELKPEGTQIFREFTTANVGKYLAIVLDKTVLSSPAIENAITDGQGVITGQFTLESANALAIQMRYGALPLPFEVVNSRLIGPTLGEDSLQKSITAGLIGFAIVILFMVLYYRLPGIIAVISILIYATITLALFKLIPVTLTLPGIAGFLLSTGSALDANILIFERLKEELRAGRTLRQAADLAWKRAWSSIRDSNIATLITCAILFIFGSSFGATIVKGFAFTLGVGVFVSLFCAIIVTRTFLTLVLDRMNREDSNLKWFGIFE